MSQRYPGAYRHADIWLGPCPCHQCRTPIWWTGWRWVGATGRKHRCEP